MQVCNCVNILGNGYTAQMELFFVCYDQPGRGPTNANGSVLTVERELFSLPLIIRSSTSTTLFFCTVATSQIHSPLGCIVVAQEFF